MKVNTKTESEFKLETIEIIIESEEELKFFWHLSNIPIRTVNNDPYSRVGTFDENTVNNMPLFRCVDDLAKRYGLKKN